MCLFYDDTTHDLNHTVIEEARRCSLKYPSWPDELKVAHIEREAEKAKKCWNEFINFFHGGLMRESYEYTLEYRPQVLVRTPRTQFFTNGRTVSYNKITEIPAHFEKVYKYPLIFKSYFLQFLEKIDLEIKTQESLRKPNPMPIISHQGGLLNSSAILSFVNSQNNWFDNDLRIPIVIRPSHLPTSFKKYTKIINALAIAILIVLAEKIYSKIILPTILRLINI